jgi:hypothetical protein
VKGVKWNLIWLSRGRCRFENRVTWVDGEPRAWGYFIWGLGMVGFGGVITGLGVYREDGGWKIRAWEMPKGGVCQCVIWG